MKKFVFFVMLILIMMVQTTEVQASGVKSIDKFDTLDGDAKYLGIQYRDNYYLDIEETGLLESGDKMINSIANILFSFVKMLAFLVVSIFYFAMNFDMAALLSTQINGIQKALSESIFQPLFVLAFAGTSLIIAKRMLKRDMTGIIGDFAKVLGILILSNFLISNSASALSASTNITKSISVSALTGLNKQMGVSNGDYAATSAGILWVSLIHEPWKTLEFGNVTPTDREVEIFLDTSPDKEEERAELVKNFREESSFSKTRGGGRIGFILVYLIPFLIKSGVYLLVALVQLLLQLMAIFFLLIAPIVLILALIPGYDVGIISIWLKKMLETQISILIITFLIGLLIKMDSLLYGLTGTYGWLPVLVFQTAMAVGLFLARNQILHAFSGVQKSMANPGYLKAMLKRSGNIYQAGEQLNAKHQKRKIYKARPNIEQPNEQSRPESNAGSNDNFSREDTTKKRNVDRPSTQESKVAVKKPIIYVKTDNENPTRPISTDTTDTDRPVVKPIPASVEEVGDKSSVAAIDRPVTQQSPVEMHGIGNSNSVVAIDRPVTQLTPASVQGAGDKSGAAAEHVVTQPSTADRPVTQPAPASVQEVGDKGSVAATDRAMAQPQPSPAEVYGMESGSSVASVDRPVTQPTPASVHGVGNKSSVVATDRAITQPSPAEVHGIGDSSSVVAIDRPITQPAPTNVQGAAAAERAVPQPSPAEVHGIGDSSSVVAVDRPVTQPVPTNVQEVGDKSSVTAAERAVPQPSPAEVHGIGDSSSVVALDRPVTQPAPTNVQEVGDKSSVTAAERAVTQPSSAEVYGMESSSSVASVDRPVTQPTPASVQGVGNKSSVVATDRAITQPSPAEVHGMESSSVASVDRPLTQAAPSNVQGAGGKENSATTDHILKKSSNNKKQAERNKKGTKTKRNSGKHMSPDTQNTVLSEKGNTVAKERPIVQNDPGPKAKEK